MRRDKIMRVSKEFEKRLRNLANGISILKGKDGPRRKLKARQRRRLLIRWVSWT